MDQEKTIYVIYLDLCLFVGDIHEIEGCIMIYLYLKVLPFLSPAVKCRGIQFYLIKFRQTGQMVTEMQSKVPCGNLNLVQHTSQAHHAQGASRTDEVKLGEGNN